MPFRILAQCTGDPVLCGLPVGQASLKAEFGAHAGQAAPDFPRHVEKELDRAWRADVDARDHATLPFKFTREEKRNIAPCAWTMCIPNGKHNEPSGQRGAFRGVVSDQHPGWFIGDASAMAFFCRHAARLNKSHAKVYRTCNSALVFTWYQKLFATRRSNTFRSIGNVTCSRPSAVTGNHRHQIRSSACFPKGKSLTTNSANSRS